MTKPQLTIASCVSNLEAFETCVLESISFLRPYLDVNILPIYNSSNVYSASIAANIAINICRSRFMLYVHQDVRILPESAPIIAELLNNWPSNVAAIGAAGVKDTVDVTISGPWGTNLRHDDIVGTVFNGDTKDWDGCGGSHVVQTIDEVFMLLDTHNATQFDINLPGFHLYGLEYCLKARQAGYDIMAANIPIEHVSRYSSSVYRDNMFLHRLIDVHAKWHIQFPDLFAPYCHWSGKRIVSYIPFALRGAYNQLIDVPRIAVTVSTNSV